MIQTYHYSNILPRLNKHFLGFYLNDRLVGVVTLGWGTRPLHTIKKIFPSLETKDYYEIGRMCMTEDMPKNSESQMLSQTIRWIKKNCPEVKVLFTWADGMVGKPGYVYQGSNFYYLGYIWTDMYMKNGIKLHPRQTKQFFAEDKEDKRLTCRPTFEQQQEVGIQHYRGKQFKYLFFTCGKREKKRLMKECTDPLSRDYPKDVDLEWKMQVGKGKWELCSRPPYSTDMNSEIDSGIGLEKAAEKDTAAKDDITGNAA